MAQSEKNSIWTERAEKVKSVFEEMQLPELYAVWFFGSQNRGDHIASSDLDVAILAESPLSQVQRFHAAQTIALKIGCEVDFVDLRAVTPDLGASIVCNQERVVTFSHAEEIDSFAAGMMSRYCNLNEERSHILADILERGYVYGK